MGNPAAEQLVELAQLALKRLCDAPPTTEAALAAIAGISESWPRRPLRIGIAGEDPAMRITLLDAACGGGVLFVRSPGSPPLRVRHGRTTRFRVFREGQEPEDHLFIARKRAVTGGVLQDQAHRDLARREHELAELERNLHGLVRRPPGRWAFWLWPIRWWRRWRAKAKLAARERAAAAIEVARKRVAEVDELLTFRAHDLRTELAEFFTAMRAADKNATEIEIEVSTGPLADGVELVELSGAARASADVDAVLIAARDGIVAPVSGGAPVRVGAADQVIPALPVFLVHARALNVARRARDRLEAACAVLTDVLDHSDRDFALRIARLEARRIRDGAELRAQQIEMLRQQIFGHIGSVMEQATMHLGVELEKLAQEWTTRVGGASTPDQLRAAVARIDSEWPETAQRIAREIRVLVAGGIGGSAHDLYGELTAPLREHGFVEKTRRPAPAIPPLALLPSLTNPTSAKWGGATEWFAGLFRSFATRLRDAADKAKQRADHVRDVARAELLDAEPLLHAALTDALFAELDAALVRHHAWVERELATERETIAAERAALMSLRRVRDNATRDIGALVEQITRLENELPGTAAASAAARLSVGSIPRAGTGSAGM